MYLTWLPDLLRDAGVRIHVLPGASTRSTTRTGLARINGIVWHDTVTPPSWSNQAVQRLLRDGHSGLRGPLSQVGLERDGLWVIVALGKCNHNGYGDWGNDSIGVEMYNAGADVGERNPPDQVESGLVGTTAILRHLGYGPERVRGHKETDPRRKVDPHALDMHGIRRQLHQRLAAPDPDPEPVEDDMADYLAQIDAIYRTQWDRGLNPDETIHYVKMLRTKPEGPQFVVNDVARQLKHPLVYT